jgi:hypothetical protein
MKKNLMKKNKINLKINKENKILKKNMSKKSHNNKSIKMMKI